MLLLDASTDISVTGSNVFSITNSGTGNSFVVNDGTSDSTPFVVDASGNVGIGTTAPGYKLDVNSGSTKIGGNFTATVLRIEATDTTGSPSIAASIQIHGYENRGKGIFITDASNTDEWFIGEGYDYAGIGIGYDTTTGSHSEYAVNTKIFVNASGSVGIGDTSPDAKLEVLGGTEQLRLSLVDGTDARLSVDTDYL